MSFISVTYAAPIIALVLLMAGPGVRAAGPTWQDIQQIKRDSLEQAAGNALDQQKRSAAAPLPIAPPEAIETTGPMQVQRRDDRTLAIELTAAPRAAVEETTPFAVGAPRDDQPLADATARLELPEPVNMLEHHSGLAMTIRVTGPTDPQVRWGARLVGANGQTADILPSVPLVSHWGEDTHEIYLDWAFINYDDVEDAIAVLESVVAIEFGAAAAKRAPQRGPSDDAKPAAFELSDLRVVDYLQGSFDPNRHSWGWDGSDDKDLTLQHRVQEVTGVVTRFGGDEAIDASIESLDLAVRTQCWDGSFLDTRRGARTITSGEYTHGFTLWGLMDAYEALEEMDAAALDETITVGPDTMSRRDFYQRMIYRGAMSRGSHVPSAYRDDIIGRDILVMGANRVLGYAIMMRRAAETLHDQDRAREVREAFDPIMDEIVAAQGKFSGGFPLLAEGDRYDGQGIHYDAGYIRTHMDWLVIGIRATGEPRLVEMFDRYQEVINAAMDQHGRGIKRLISERGRGTSPVQLVLPDAHAQVGLEHELPAMAQWGYNVSHHNWSQWEPGARVNHFTSQANNSGYSLGAHTNILLADIDAEPEPRDIGYRFPRQFPIWSSRLYHKDDGQHVRTSRVAIHPEGRMVNDFRIEVGEYLTTVGVPVTVDSPDGVTHAQSDDLQGWPTRLPDDAELQIRGTGIDQTAGIGQAVELTLDGETELTITGPDVTLPAEAGGETVPFEAKLTLEPEAGGQRVILRVHNTTPDYEHEMPNLE